MDTTQRTARKHRRIRELYYITHIDNVPSILEKGIFSHERIKTEGIKYTAIYDEEIISRRQELKVPDGRTLWSFANLYFRARNPMLYRVRCEKSVNDIAVLGVDKAILERPDVFVTTGNAASAESEILPSPASRKVISRIAKEIDIEWWHQFDGSKRKIMAECLVPNSVFPQYIKSIYTASFDARNKIQTSLNKMSVPFGLSVIYQPKMFFQPSRHIDLTPQLSLVDGDMFFSRMQTLTVSVNCVGVMGKGVASRAKYQFPDVYVRYQDSCRSRKLTMGKPVLYKRESSIDYQLADDPETLTNANSETWFLLFATKRHWRERSDIEGIEKGLQWLSKNYKTDGVKSLAIPALGCGLGRLKWRDIGPLLCKYLSGLDIPVSIYLPTERKVPEKYLSRDFLLPQQKLVDPKREQT